MVTGDRWATVVTLALVLVIPAVAVATGSTTYGGAVPAPAGVTLHSVCGDSSQGLLFAVGTDGTNGVIYRIDSLTTEGYVRLKGYKPGWANSFIFYACEVVDSYLFATAEGRSKQGDIRSTFVVYSITQQKTLSHVDERSTGVGAGTVRFRDVDVKKVGSTYYIYALSVADSSVVLYYTSFTGGALGSISSVTIGTGDGYGVSIWGNYLGLLWRDGNSNLLLSVFDVSGGSPNNRQDVVVVQGFTGARAAEAAYSEGFLVAVAGELYRVYLSGGNWISGEFVDFKDPNVVECDPYAMLVAESGGAKAAYIFSQTRQDGTIRMCFIAVDLVGKGVIRDPLTILQQPMEGYGDAYIVWVDSSMNIVSRGSSSPYMVYTVTDGASSSHLIYYDLTQGGSLPYPVPEPWFTSLAVLASTVAAVATILRRAG